MHAFMPPHATHAPHAATPTPQPQRQRQVKQTLNDLRDVPGMDEAFLKEQIERLKVRGSSIGNRSLCALSG